MVGIPYHVDLPCMADAVETGQTTGEGGETKTGGGRGEGVGLVAGGTNGRGARKQETVLRKQVAINANVDRLRTGDLRRVVW